MSINLLDLAKGYITNDVVAKASSFIGEDAATTSKGFDAILPTLLGGLAGKAGDRSSVSDMYNVVSKPEFGGGLLNNIGDLFSSSETSSSALNLGGSLLNNFFGNKTNSMFDTISSFAGMKSGSASTLTKLALPILMSVIGKKVKSEGLGLDGFMNMMKNQQDVVAKNAPEGLLSKLGALGFGGLGAAATNIGNKVQNTGSTVVNTAKAPTETATTTVRTPKAGESTTRTASRPVPENNKPSNGGFKKFLPLILIVGALLLALWLMRGCNKDGVKDGMENVIDEGRKGVNAVGDGVKDGVNAVGEGVKDGANAVGNTVASGADAIYSGGKDLVGKTVEGFENLGSFMNRKLKNGTELIIPSKGGEAKLIEFIESKDKVNMDDKSEGWFDLRRVLFETGSAKLDTRSKNQIENVAEIMKAYPNVHIKIGGYTDNVGDPAFNLDLSDKRANSVMNELVSLGIDKSRLAAEGYGENHPIASNDTEEGRQLNRRVAARVTQK